MPLKPSVVAIVLDEDPSLVERLLSEMRVWAARTPASEALAASLERDGPAGESLTIFELDREEDVEDKVIQLIYDIDLHYGSSGGHLPLQRLEVYGTALTDPMKHTLENFGLLSAEVTTDGFTAVRAS